MRTAWHTKAINDGGVISESEMPEVMRAKYELLGRDSPLSFEYETAQFAEIGWDASFAAVVGVRRSFFIGPEAPENLDPPRGVLLLGVQGCGKSLAAKAAAGIYGCRCCGSISACSIANTTAKPKRTCLKPLKPRRSWRRASFGWTKSKKGLATGDEDDGLSRRVLGSLVIWMSERRKPVFVVATANDITRLPPELVRKGRFDEIFFVDLPSAQNRRDILMIHLRKRSLQPGGFDMEALTKATEASQVRKSSKRLCRRCTPPTPRDGMFPRRICWLKFNKPARFQC